MKKIYLFLSLLSCLSLKAFSQNNENSNGSSPFSTTTSTTSTTSSTWAPYCYPCRYRHYGNCTPPSTPVPIDGGLSVLLIAGAAYGVKRIARKKPEA